MKIQPSNEIPQPAVPRLEKVSRRIQKHIDALEEIKKLIREIWGE